MRYILFVSLLFAYSLNLKAQSPQVNKATGSLSMSKAIYNLNLEGKSFPLVASYSNSGMLVGANGGLIGHGWQLSTSGGVRRITKGKPDFQINGHGVSSWTQIFAPIDPNEIKTTAENMEEGCYFFDYPQNFSSDFDEIKDLISDDPLDEYEVNFMGISGTIVLDPFNGYKAYFKELNNFKVRAVMKQVTVEGEEIWVDFEPYQGMLKGIDAFEVTDNNGFKYIFSQQIKVVEMSGRPGQFIGGFFDYDKFMSWSINSDNSLRYTSFWAITDIISPAGEKINFSYFTVKEPEIEGDENATKSTSYNLAYIKEPNADYNYTGYGSLIKEAKHTWTFPYVIDEIKVYNTAGASASDWDQKLDFHTGNFKKHKLEFLSGVEIEKNNKYGDFNNGEWKLQNIEVFQKNEFGAFKAFDVLFKYHPYDQDGLFFLKSIQMLKNNIAMPANEYVYHNIDNFYFSPSAAESDFWGYQRSNNNYSSVYQSKPFAQKVNILPNRNPDKPENDNWYSYYYSHEHSLVGGDFIEAINLAGKTGYDLDAIMYGSLIGLRHAQGTYTKIDYETNTYYDPMLQAEQYGGGIRVSRISNYEQESDAYFVGNSEANSPAFVEYEYVNEEGISSGHAINKPRYVFPVPGWVDTTSGEYMNYDALLAQNNTIIDLQYIFTRLSVRTSNNLSPDNNYVFYDRVKEKYATGGYKLFNFNVPYFELLEQTEDYPQSRMIFFSSETEDNCDDLWILRNYGMPNYLGGSFASVDHLYGQLLSVKTYDSDNKLLDERINLYKTINEDESKYANYFSLIDSSKSELGKYKILISHPDSYLLSTFNDKTISRKYDKNDPTKYHEAITYKNFDESINQVNAVSNKVGGRFSQQQFIYPEYFDSTQLGNSEMDEAIRFMLNNNITGQSIEQISSVGSDSTQLKIVGASLSLLGIENGYLVAQKGLSFSEIDPQSFENTLEKSQSGFNYDTLYETNVSFADFDGRTYLTSTDKTGHSSSFQYDKLTGQQLLNASNAEMKEVVYTNFRSNNEQSFSFDAEQLKDDRHILLPSKQISIENYQNKSKVYRFKVLTDNSKSGVFTLIIRNSANNALMYQANQSINGSGAAMQLLEWTVEPETKGAWDSIDMINISLTSNTDLNVYEVIHQPRYASVSTSYYNLLGQMVRSLSDKGKLREYFYDGSGRQVLVKDENGDLLGQTNYKLKKATPLDADFSYIYDIESSEYKCQAVKNPSGTEYYWKVDNGEEQKDNSTFSVPSATSTVTLRLVHEDYPSDTKTIDLN